MVAQGKLPAELQVLLENPRIRKVGRLIKSDLANLQEICKSTTPFCGELDLAWMAKERCLFHNIRTTSLSDLTARVLHRRLNKNSSERISTAWNNPNLTPEQINYASLDAYASLKIYEALIAIPLPRRLCHIQDLAPPGTSVMIYSIDKKSFVGSGRTVNEIKPNAVPSHVSVKVTDILHRGAKLAHDPSKTLADFGAVPFTLERFPHTHLVVYYPHPSPPTPPTSQLSDDEPPPFSAIIPPSSLVLDQPQINNEGYERDLESAAEADAILGPLPTSWPTTIRSRVLKDVFHLLRMFDIPRGHALCGDFFRAVRDALLLLDAKDAAACAAYCESQNPPLPYQKMRESWSAWLAHRCKRVIAPPEIVYPRMHKVVTAYGPLKDAITGKPLIEKHQWKSVKRVLDLVYAGLVSDPPGVPLYAVTGCDTKAGLDLYRCFRGTNITEGGVHTHLRPHLPTSGASLEHVVASLHDFVLRHNLLVRHIPVLCFGSFAQLRTFCRLVHLIGLVADIKVTSPYGSTMIFKTYSCISKMSSNHRMEPKHRHRISTVTST